MSPNRRVGCREQEVAHQVVNRLYHQAYKGHLMSGVRLHVSQRNVRNNETIIITGESWMFITMGRGI